MVVGDFDHTAYHDVVVTSWENAPSLFYYASTGEGTYAPPVPLGSLGQTWGAAAGDFNNDNELDFAVTANAQHAVEAFLGNGDGTFVQIPVAAYAVSQGGPRHLFVLDANGDAHSDVLHASSNGVPNVYLSLWVPETASFAPFFSVFYGGLAASSSQAFHAADFDGDGVDEIIVSNTLGLYYLSPPYAPEGVGTSTPPLFSPHESNAIGVADFDNDGRLDLALDVDDTGLSWAPLFTRPLIPDQYGHDFTHPNANSAGYSVVAADFSGDSVDDIIVGGWGQLKYFASSPSIDILNVEPVTLTPPSTGATYVLRAADLDHDLALDLVGASFDSVWILANDGSGNFPFAPALVATYPTPASYGAALGLADLDGNGQVDICYAPDSASSIICLPVLSLTGSTLSLGPSPWVTAPPGGLSETTSITFGDVNQDGHLDLAYSSGVGPTPLGWVPFNGSTFSPTPVTWNDPAADYPRRLELHDMDADGDLDVVYNAWSNRYLAWAPNDGSGLFGTPVSIGLGLDWVASFVIFDLDGDAQVDIVVHGYLGSGVFFGTTPTATAFDFVPFNSGDYPYDIAIGDFNADGFVDLVSTDRDSGGFVHVAEPGMLTRPTYAETIDPRARPSVCAYKTDSLACYQRMLSFGSSCWTQRPIELTATQSITSCNPFSGLPLASGESLVITSPDKAGFIDCGPAGGALFDVNGGSLTLSDITISRATHGSATDAASPIRVRSVGSLTATNVVFESCSTAGGSSLAVNSGIGGVMTIETRSSLVTSNVTFRANTAQTAGGALALVGIGPSLSLSDTTFTANVAIDNSPSSRGGALAVFAFSSSILLHNSSFVANSAQYGGAIATTPLAHATDLQSISSSFLANSALAGGAIADVGAASSSLSFDPNSHFDANSAEWGGSLALLGPLNTELPSSPASTSLLSLLPLQSDSATTTTTTTTTTTLSLTLTGSVGSSTATHGGFAYVCGNAFDATNASFTGPLLAQGAGGFAFGCSSSLVQAPPSPSPTPLHSHNHPLDTQWALGPPTPSLPASANAYGTYYATPPTAMELDFNNNNGGNGGVTTTFKSGTHPSGVVLVTDAFGQVIQNSALVLSISAPTLSLVATAPQSGVSPLVLDTFTLAATESQLDVPHVTTLSLATAQSQGGGGGGGASAEVAGEWVPTIAMDLILTGCPPGEGRVSAENAPLLCDTCPADTESPGTSGAACVALRVCPEGDILVDGECTGCPVNTARVVLNSTHVGPCRCVPGAWARGGVSDVPCDLCPPGAMCLGGTEPPLAVAGFFRAGEGLFVECKRPAGCTGGASVCDAGYTGYMCNECQEGYFSDAARLCQACPSSSSTVLIVFMVLVVLAAFAAAGATLVFVRRAHNSMSETGGTMHRARRFPATIAMAVIALQMVAILADAKFSWSSRTRDLLSVFHVFNVDLNLVASECSLGGFREKYLLSIGLPLGFFSLVIVVFATLRRIPSLGGSNIPAMTAVNMILFSVAPLFYIPLSRATLILFDCTELPNGDIVLDVDPGVGCLDAEWWRIAPAGFGALAVYVIGLPVYFAVILFRHRDVLFEPRVFVQYGGLYRLYSASSYAGELGNMAKRLAIVSASLFVSDHQAVLVGILLFVFIASMMVVSTRRPYFFDIHNTTDRNLSAILVVILLIGSGSYAEDDSTRDSSIIFVLAIVAVVAILAIALYGISIELKQIARPYSVDRVRTVKIVKTLRSAADDIYAGPVATTIRQTADMFEGLASTTTFGSNSKVGPRSDGGGGEVLVELDVFSSDDSYSAAVSEEDADHSDHSDHSDRWDEERGGGSRRERLRR